MDTVRLTAECKCSGHVYPHTFRAAGCIAPAPVRFGALGSRPR